MKFGALEWAVSGNIFLLLVIFVIIIYKVCKDRKESKKEMEDQFEDFNPNNKFNTMYARPNPQLRVQNQDFRPIPHRTPTPTVYSTSTLPAKSSMRPYWVPFPPLSPPGSMNIPMTMKPCRHSSMNSPQHLLPVHSCCKKLSVPGYPGRY